MSGGQFEYGNGSPVRTGLLRLRGLGVLQRQRRNVPIGHGGGASSQHTYCTPISWLEALPGDLVFYPGDRHAGIVVGHDTFGNIKIMHCASGSNNVVITGKIGFVSIGRPQFFSGS